MNFVQTQQIIIPGNVGYTTELIADHCYRGPGLTLLGDNRCAFVHGSLLNLQGNVLL